MSPEGKARVGVSRQKYMFWMNIVVSALILGSSIGDGSMTFAAVDSLQVEQLPQLEQDQPPSVLELTIVFDNNPWDPLCQTSWGFSCLVEGLDETILFDTGNSGCILLDNMAILGKKVSDVDIVVLSHAHGDHTGGLDEVLDACPGAVVYIPAGFPQNVKQRLQGTCAELVALTEPGYVADYACTTGQMGRWIKEQGLIVSTNKGPVLITGCAHPGIISMTRRAADIAGQALYLVMGGFHLDGASPEELDRIITGFKQEQVQEVAPCHCTGSSARELFRLSYAEHFHDAGVGYSIVID